LSRKRLIIGKLAKLEARVQKDCGSLTLAGSRDRRVTSHSLKRDGK